jgi:hypothetical protein
MHSTILYRLTWLALACSLGHHLDHLIRGNAVGLPIERSVSPAGQRSRCTPWSTGWWPGENSRWADDQLTRSVPGTAGPAGPVAMAHRVPPALRDEQRVAGGERLWVVRLVCAATASSVVVLLVLLTAWGSGSRLGAPTYWPWLLTGTQVAALWAAGGHHWWGWPLGASVQPPWIAYALMTDQLGFIPGCMFSGAVQTLSFLRGQDNSVRHSTPRDDVRADEAARVRAESTKEISR